MKKIYDKIIKEVQKYFKKTGVKKAVIGLSGGIDSSLCARLVADAIGKENLHGIIMPVKGLSNEQNVDETIRFCHSIGISHSLIYINEFVGDFNHLKINPHRFQSLNRTLHGFEFLKKVMFVEYLQNLA